MCMRCMRIVALVVASPIGVVPIKFIFFVMKLFNDEKKYFEGSIGANVISP